MKKILFVSLLMYAYSSIATTRYVKQTSSGLGDGTSWTNASNDLQAMINASNTTNGDTVFVAAGIYKPNLVPPLTVFSATTNRDYAFILRENIKIYGNFSGNESGLADRNVWDTLSKTTLSGDLNGDDATGFLNTSENVYHVLISAGNIGTAIIDGFTIIGGNANGGTNLNVNNLNLSRAMAGGMLNQSSSPVISNCTFIANQAGGGGAGAMLNQNGSPVITNCHFIGNLSPVNCGGMTNLSSSPTIINCIFSGNKSGIGSYGGAMGNFGTSITIINCTISGNKATNGAGIYMSSGQLNVTNTIIWGNSDGIYSQNSATVNINHSLVQGLTSTANGNLNGNTNPLFTNASASDYTLAPFYTSDYQLQNTSPCVNSGINTVSGIVMPTVDIAGNQRIFGSNMDMGSYELQQLPLALDLVNFNGQTLGNYVQLQWQYLHTDNIASFIIERSSDAVNFTTIGKTTSQENDVHYNFYDEQPLYPIAYYRLKVETINETIYSNVVMIRSNKNSAINIWPVPATMFIIISNSDPSLNGTQASISDMTGQIIKSIKVNTTQEIDTHGWPSGVYILKLQNGINHKIIIR